MQRDVAPEIKSRSDLDSAVDDATQVLGEIMGHSSMSQAIATWTMSKDPAGRDLVRLLVSDWTGAVAYVFAPEELKNRDLLKYRLDRLWGDLLQVSSHVQFDGLLGDVDPAGGF